MFGLDKQEFKYVVDKYTQTKKEEDKAHQDEFNPNKAGAKSPYSAQLCLVLLLLHFRRKWTPWDLYLYFHLSTAIISAILEKTEVILDKALSPEIYLPDEATRLRLAQLYNLPEHKNIVMVFDGALFETKKSIDKTVQADNWCYKGYQARNVEFGVLVNGRIVYLGPSHPGGVNDIAQTKFNKAWMALNPATEKSGTCISALAITKMISYSIRQGI